jgi:hypothetical protein
VSAVRRPTPARNGDLAAIHIAKAKLRLSDDEYRDLMATVCSGVRSAAALDWTGRRRFLEHLNVCLRHGVGPGGARHIRQELTPVQRRMWALWMQLADAGLVRERSMLAIEAWVRGQIGVDRLEWMTSQQEHLVVERLKRWLQRVQRGPESDS